MKTALTEYKHIQIDERGIPIIIGSMMKVIDVVMAQMAYGWTPEEIQINHRYLSMSQIHSAFAYYWDHKEELDMAIAADLEYAKKMRQQAIESPFTARLKAQGILK